MQTGIRKATKIQHKISICGQTNNLVLCRTIKRLRIQTYKQHIKRCAIPSTVKDQRIILGKLISLDGMLLAYDYDLSLYDLMPSLVFLYDKTKFLNHIWLIILDKVIIFFI